MCCTAASLILAVSTAYAQPHCPNPSVPVNRSTELPGNFFDDQVLAGCDPYCPDGENDYCQQGGTRRGSPGSSGASITSDVSKPRWDCPPTMKLDTTCGQEYPDCTGRPGGRSDGGAESVCDHGTGSPTMGLNGILDGIFPGFGAGFGACLMKLIGGLNISSVGGFIGSFINNVNGGVHRQGTCIGGSVAVCGFSLAGESCLTDENGDPIDDYTEGLSYIEVFAPAEITVGNAREHFQGPVIVVDGGTMDDYGTINPGEIVQVFINDEGESALYVFPAGTSIADITSGAARRVGNRVARFDDDEDFFRVITLNGLARVPAENIALDGPDDQDRISDDVADDYIGHGDAESERAVDLNGDGIPDGEGIDTDGDGIIDGVDTNGDGEIDVPGIDINGDGIIDGVGIDTNGDGIIDGIDTDGNGIDIRGIDTNGDGVSDGIGVDANHDGIIDGIDTNGDGVVDIRGIDRNGDGVIDSIPLDTNGDGIIDGLDTNGDGASDVPGIDTDGDGVKDGVPLDTDGDGAFDGLDTNGDGRVDIPGVDYNGDGKRDGIEIDANGDGIKDGVDTNGDNLIDHPYH